MRKASEFITKAAEIVGERETTHGRKIENFSGIAALWSAYTGIDLTPHDVGNMMILVKMNRTNQGKFNADDYVDIAGYAGCNAEVALDMIDDGWAEAGTQ